MNKRNISIKNGVVLMMILCVVGLCSIFVKYCISKNEYQREIQDIQTLKLKIRLHQCLNILR